LAWRNRTHSKAIVPSAKVLDIAFDSGFGDVSNVDHAFKREFGASLRGFNLRHGPASAAAAGHF